LRENEIVLATIFLITMKFKHLQLVLQSKNKNTIEYYKNIVMATICVINSEIITQLYNYTFIETSYK